MIPLKHRFSSEKLLQQALAGLLLRMPNVTEVQILQGPLEAGKDLVFRYHGGFGESILCACVVKNKKITGTVEKRSGAQVVMFQARQAFLIPHPDGLGRVTPVEKVYVITPYEITPEAVASIRGEMPGPVKFIGGSNLFDL